MKTTMILAAALALGTAPPSLAQDSQQGQNRNWNGQQTQSPQLSPPNYLRSATEDMNRAVPPMTPGSQLDRAQGPGGWTADGTLRRSGQQGAVENRQADQQPGRQTGSPQADQQSSNQGQQAGDQQFESSRSNRQGSQQQTRQAAREDRQFDYQQSNRPEWHERQSGQQQPGQQQQVGQFRAMSQATLKAALEKAGFSDIKVLDASYLVHARTSDGQLVVVTINPPSVMADNTHHYDDYDDDRSNQGNRRTDRSASSSAGDKASNGNSGRNSQ